MNHPPGSEQHMLDAVLAFCRENFPEMIDDGDLMDFSIKLFKNDAGDAELVAWIMNNGEGDILHEEGEYFNA